MTSPSVVTSCGRATGAPDASAFSCFLSQASAILRVLKVCERLETVFEPFFLRICAVYRRLPSVRRRSTMVPIAFSPCCEGKGKIGRVGESRSGVTRRRFQVLGGDLAQGFRRDYMAPNRDYMVVPAAEIAPKCPEPTPIGHPRRSL